ncbi:uncharacterized protein LOC130997662 [Salvia miltiorrhiza]|uniref:uncharacterized protein LOC130997662 n=1 Tax=Salvia miltiorrhiza TaxID=226208 RepID=UPI0025AD5E25|nr:uncharacterized protein LOC130997662 [Salvia miltiorrhiza]
MAEIEEISRKLKGTQFLKIEVVDDTALIDTALISKGKISRRQESKTTAIAMKKRPRKDWKIKKTCAKKYSRPEMLALSLRNLDHQRNTWSHIYAALTASVAAEYDGLLAPAPPRPIFIHNCDDGASAMGKRSPLKISVH